MKTRYFLTDHPVLGEKEVTEKEWIAAERAAGFFPKYGIKGPATGGFSNSHTGVSGRIEFITQVQSEDRPSK
jgi:hypothetical protein